MRIQMLIKESLSDKMIAKCNRIGLEINQYILYLIIDDLKDEKLEESK